MYSTSHDLYTLFALCCGSVLTNVTHTLHVCCTGEISRKSCQGGEPEENG